MNKIFNMCGGRKYFKALILYITATIALFTNRCSFVEWGAFSTSVLFVYAVTNVYQATKLEKPKE